MTEKLHVLLGCTGSVASIKVPYLIRELLSNDCRIDIKVIPTKCSLHFFDKSKLDTTVLCDEDEWTWSSLEDPVLHIELRKWADIMVIAPLDANTLAKVSHGLCDNLLTSIIRAWDFTRPLIFAPAMNTHMWEHPFTKQQIEILKGLGFIEVPCIEKKLACGDTGYGAMAEVSSICAVVMEMLKQYKHDK